MTVQTDGFYYERRKLLGLLEYTCEGKYDAWNDLVRRMGNTRVCDIARACVGSSSPPAADKIDSETGETKFRTGMQLLEAHLSARGFPCEMVISWNLALRFDVSLVCGENRWDVCKRIRETMLALEAKLQGKTTIRCVISQWPKPRGYR